jgi:hypothetical protein
MALWSLLIDQTPKLLCGGQFLFACLALWSNTIRGGVDKLSYPFTRSWHIIADFPVAS